MNRSAIRIIWIVLAAIILTLGVSGCMSKNQANKAAETQPAPAPEVIKERVLAHLQEKYGEEFVPMSFSGSGWAYPYNQMVLYPKKDSASNRFEARIVINKDGTYDISDGYFGVLIAPEYAKIVSGIVKEIYEDFKMSVDFGEGVYPDRLNKDTKIEDIYNENEIFNANVTIFVKEAAAKGIDTDASLQKLAKSMIERKLVSNIKIYIVYDNKFDSFTTDVLKTAKSRKEYFKEDYKIVMIGRDLEIFHAE